MVWTHFVFTQSEVSHEPCGGFSDFVRGFTDFTKKDSQLKFWGGGLQNKIFRTDTHRYVRQPKFSGEQFSLVIVRKQQHVIFDLVTRPERRHASIMNGSGTESRLADVEFENSHMHKNLKNFQEITNGIGDMTLFHIFANKIASWEFEAFLENHSVFWNETVYNHLCVFVKQNIWNQHESKQPIY